MEIPDSRSLSITSNSLVSKPIASSVNFKPMKKAQFNYMTATAVATRNSDPVREAEKLIREKSLSNPPSEETVSRLHAIAREYPFCAYIRQNHLSIL
jgi:hypothetical protein